MFKAPDSAEHISATVKVLSALFDFMEEHQFEQVTKNPDGIQFGIRNHAKTLTPVQVEYYGDSGILHLTASALLGDAPATHELEMLRLFNGLHHAFPSAVFTYGGDNDGEPGVRISVGNFVEENSDLETALLGLRDFLQYVVAHATPVLLEFFEQKPRYLPPNAAADRPGRLYLPISADMALASLKIGQFGTA